MGVIVSALGIGGVVFTPVIESLITYFGGTEVGELDTFRVISGIFLVVCTYWWLVLKKPPNEEQNTISIDNGESALEKKECSPSQVLKMPEFYIITFTLMLACMGGLMMIGFEKPIAVAKSLEETATIGVLIVSICNASGRFLWGFISDKNYMEDF